MRLPRHPEMRPFFFAGPREESRDISQNSTVGLTPFKPFNGLQEIPVATRDESRVLCFHSRRGLTPPVNLECHHEIPVATGEETEILDTSLDEVYLPCSDTRAIPSSL